MKRAERRWWSKERRRVDKLGGKSRAGARRHGARAYERVVAPLSLDVYRRADRPAMMRFLMLLRARASQPKSGLIVDLSRVKRMFPTGALLLWAELDRARAAFGHASAVTVIRPADPVAYAVMCQIGIIEADAARMPEFDRDDVRHWRAATGMLCEGEKGGTILQLYEGRLAEGIAKGLYAGLVEAMTNTVHHAYQGEEGRDLMRNIGKRWWLLSQERDGILTMAICDLGIGIPRSLPRSESFGSELVKKVWRGLGLDRSDVSAIKVAIEIGRTRTRQEERGKGLGDIVRAVNLSDSGRVFICSNRGVYSSRRGKPVEAWNDGNSIRGTLIHWNVPTHDGGR